MLRLPTCPHCNTVYRYKDVNKAMQKRDCTCYNCGKKFEVSKKKFLILFLEIALICAIFDVLALYMTERISFVLLVVLNAVFIAVGLLFRAFFVKFKKLDIPLDKTQEKAKKAIDTRNYNKKRKK